MATDKPDPFGEWLAAQTCEIVVDGEVCGKHAGHNQDGKHRCNAHMDPNRRAFALND